MLAQLPGLLFGLRAPVDRRTYALTGVILMTLKYAIDVALVYALSGRIWGPLEYFNPVFMVREGNIQLDGAFAPYFSIAMIVWALPFLWVGVSMSVRRCINAGYPAWVGLFFFMPVANFFLILVLCMAKTRTQEPVHPHDAVESSVVVAALKGIGVGVGVSVVMTGVSTLLMGSYGAALFLGMPFIMGFSAAWFLNRTGRVSFLASWSAMALSLVGCGLALLLFALEGVLCLAMATPIALVLGTLGAVLGHYVGAQASLSTLQAASLLLGLPVMLGFESQAGPAPEREVITTIEIDAPPQAVWNNIIGWTELPNDELPWYFAVGVAYPMRAEIHGMGVGAVRHCVFSTGPFVEPITVWDEPRRLGFDVASQPPGMEEWSPWSRVHAPHLEGFFVSHRGEFRLIELPGGRTRLEGSTWYHMDIWPQAYWALFADAILHGIHERVLEHVGNLAVAEVAAR